MSAGVGILQKTRRNSVEIPKVKRGVAAAVWAKIHEPKWITAVSALAHLIIGIMGALVVASPPDFVPTNFSAHLIRAGAILFIIGGGLLGVFPALAGAAYFERFGMIFSLLGFILWSLALFESQTVTDIPQQLCLHLICICFLATRLFRVWGEPANLAGGVFPFSSGRKVTSDE